MRVDYMKQYTSATWVIILIIGMSVPCRAEQTAVFGALPDIVPLSYEENGIIKGYFTDMFLEAAHRAGFEVHLRAYPLKRVEEYLQSGEIDGVVSMVHTKAREEYLIYSTTPIAIGHTRVFVKKGRAFPFKSANDLVGKKIGAIVGWKTGNQALEQAIEEGTLQIEKVTQLEQNLKKLMADRIDCFIGTELLTWYRANKLEVAEYLEALKTPVSELSVFFAVTQHTKNIADPQAFIEKMSAALDEVLADGTSDKLKTQYKVTSLK